jgi:hypothetical protein
MCTEPRSQREGEEAVGNGATERSLLRAADVDVNPLMVAGRLGEGVDTGLIDGHPARDAKRLAGRLGDFVEGREHPHDGSPFHVRLVRGRLWLRPPRSILILAQT